MGSSWHSYGFLSLCLFICECVPVSDFLPPDANIDDIQRARYKNLHQFETMHIMADLETETLLFTLKYRSDDGLLLIYPDLNSIEANPYLIEINADSRNLYQFAIENLSTDSTNETLQLRNDIEVLANKVRDANSLLCGSSTLQSIRYICHIHSLLNTYSYQIYAFVHRSYSICPTSKRPPCAFISKSKVSSNSNTMTFTSSIQFICPLRAS